MKALSLIILVPMLTAFKGYTQTLSGKEIFTGNCQSCHSIGGGDVVGPDLAGITENRRKLDKSLYYQFTKPDCRRG